MPSKNPEVRRRAHAKFKEVHPNYQQEWHAENPGKRKEYQTKYETENQEKIRAKGRRYYAKNRDKLRARQRAYRAAHPEKAAERQLFKKFGITLPDKEIIWLIQDKKCAICRDEIDLLGAHTDHIHGTKIIRGLLCGNCNWGLGNFLDNPAILRAAADYLRPFQSKISEQVTAGSSPTQ